MAIFDSILDRIARMVTGVVQSEVSGYEPYTPSDPATLKATLEPGDILLVEGNQKLSAAIKYLTQSTWSHAAIYVGDRLPPDPSGDHRCLVEADIREGVISVPLSKYETFNTRICRPMNLTEDDREAVLDHVIGRIGHHYDTRNIFDLLRYLIPTPPIPIRWRRRMIALGSGDPTRAICSTMIAMAFQKIRYPILPLVSSPDDPSPRVRSCYSRHEIMHIRHHSLFAPRDFDVSPFFRIVKPTIESGFNYKGLKWGEDTAADGQIGSDVSN